MDDGEWECCVKESIGRGLEEGRIKPAYADIDTEAEALPPIMSV